MKVSVIIPFHKGLSMLADCLQSLAEQTVEDMEVLLVCDHTEEDVSTFIGSYDTIHLKVLELQENTGVAAARNLGLNAAAGEYIYFLDSDDYIADSALGLLMDTAKSGGSDLIYGKRIGTWQKRSLYLQSNHREDGGEGGSEESSEDSEDSHDNENADANSEDGEEDAAEYAKGDKAPENAQTVFEQDSIQEAYRHIITECSGVRNISVLHILIRRALLSSHHIRFREEIKYLCDYPFLLWVMEKAQSFAYEPQALYMKRIHKEPGSLPLSQLPGSRSFQEYVETYQYTIGLLKEDGELKRLLDRKMMEYCVKHFAPKLAEKKKAGERAKKFEVLHQILHSMNQDLFQNLKGYRRRVLTDFRKGDLPHARRAAVRHQKWEKLKAITKRKSAFFKFLYQKYFLKLSMKENWVFFESYFGKSYSDSPRYLYEYLAEKHPKQYKFIWVMNKKSTSIPYKHVKIRRFGLRYFYYLARSKYYVFNGRQPVWVKKRKGNVFLQTWHGTPLKRLVFDLDTVSASRKKYKDETYSQSRAWDFLIAANKYSSDIFRRCFKYEKTILETGYPRNDILHGKNKDQAALTIKRKLGIPEDKKVILYAPTWRDDEYTSMGRYKFRMMLDLKLLEEKLGREYVILMRTHYFVAESIDNMCGRDFVYNMSSYDDIADLYLISSILITDYSSVFFDFANLRRPILFFTYDLDKYRDILRGFYIDMEKDLPGPLLFTTEEIISAVENLDKLQLEYKQKYDAFYEKYCSWEDGNASGRVAKEVFKL